MTKIKFGKGDVEEGVFPSGDHKGSRIEVVPTDYLRFCLEADVYTWLHDAIEDELETRRRKEEYC